MGATGNIHKRICNGPQKMAVGGISEKPLVSEQKGSPSMTFLPLLCSAGGGKNFWQPCCLPQASFPLVEKKKLSLRTPSYSSHQAKLGILSWGKCLHCTPKHTWRRSVTLLAIKSHTSSKTRKNWFWVQPICWSVRNCGDMMFSVFRARIGNMSVTPHHLSNV